MVKVPKMFRSLSEEEKIEKEFKARVAKVQKKKEGLRLKGGAAEDYDVFISLRFSEAEQEAKMLQQALNNRGKKTFICDVGPGGNLIDSIIEALTESKLTIIMGTKTYGQQGTTKFSSKQELSFIMQEDKPFYLIKMCERFEDAKTRFYLNEDVSYQLWEPGTPMPDNLVTNIEKRLTELEGGSSKPESGFGEYTYPNGVKYIGMWQNHEPNGIGRQEYYDGSVFEGSFKDGFREGLGKYTYGAGTTAPGDLYEGNYKRGRRDGQGKYIYSPTGPNAGDQYIGNWKDGMRHGYGTYFYRTGDKYDGEWVEGKKQGKGIYTYGGENTGDVYNGDYYNNFRHGHGEYKYRNGDHYIGDWVENKKHGKGTFLFNQSGNKYEGEWKDGFMDGYGEFFWGPGSGAHGASYKGQFEKGQRNGHGTYTSATGEVKEGNWVNGELA